MVVKGKKTSSMQFTIELTNFRISCNLYLKFSINHDDLPQYPAYVSRLKQAIGLPKDFESKVCSKYFIPAYVIVV